MQLSNYICFICFNIIGHCESNSTSIVYLIVVTTYWSVVKLESSVNNYVISQQNYIILWHSLVKNFDLKLKCISAFKVWLINVVCWATECSSVLAL